MSDSVDSKRDRRTRKPAFGLMALVVIACAVAGMAAPRTLRAQDPSPTVAAPAPEAPAPEAPTPAIAAPPPAPTDAPRPIPPTPIPTITFAPTFAPTPTSQPVPNAVIWSKSVLLSSPGSFPGAPAIAADSTGMLHAMWSERPLDVKTTAEGLYFMYAQFDGINWTKPVDVVATFLQESNGEELGAEAPSLAYTPDGFLHLAWGTGGESSQLIYARAPACCANRATNWTKPVSLGIPVNIGPTLVSDTQGRLHVAFADLESGNISYLRSDDSGITWNLRRLVQGKVRVGNEQPAYPRMAVDSKGRVHLVWSVLPFPGVFVLYARSDDGGETWTEPQIIDRADSGLYLNENYGPIFVSIATTIDPNGKERLHMIWDGAPTVERNYIYSDDGGVTWSQRYLAFPEIRGVGRAGYNPMVMDSAGTLHGTSFFWYSTWLGNGWLPNSIRFIESNSAEQGSVVISLGNQINVVWQDKFSEGIPPLVGFASGIAAAPRLAPQPLPEIPPEIRKLQPVAPGLRPQLPNEPTKAPFQPSPVPTWPAVNPEVVNVRSNPMDVAVLGVVPVLAFLVIVTLVVFTRRARR